MAFPNAHNQPGRRFAALSTKDDQILGAFGFVAHATLFMSIGAAVANPHDLGLFFWANAVVAAILLLLRATQVQATTTKESLKAIKDAWLWTSNG